MRERQLLLRRQQQQQQGFHLLIADWKTRSINDEGEGCTIRSSSSTSFTTRKRRRLHDRSWTRLKKAALWAWRGRT